METGSVPVTILGTRLSQSTQKEEKKMDDDLHDYWNPHSKGLDPLLVKRFVTEI